MFYKRIPLVKKLMKDKREILMKAAMEELASQEREFNKILKDLVEKPMAYRNTKENAIAKRFKKLGFRVRYAPPTKRGWNDWCWQISIP